MSDRKITVKSGNKEFTLGVAEEENQKYYCPWWQQKKREQRNREAMEQSGYTEELYEAWKDNVSEEVGIPDMELPGMDKLVEKKLLLSVLADAMDSLLRQERELAMRVFGKETPLADYADMKKQNPRMFSDHKWRILSKLRNFFMEHGFEVDNE